MHTMEEAIGTLTSHSRLFINSSRACTSGAGELGGPYISESKTFFFLGGQCAQMLGSVDYGGLVWPPLFCLYCMDLSAGVKAPPRKWRVIRRGDSGDQLNQPLSDVNGPEVAERHIRGWTEGNECQWVSRCELGRRILLRHQLGVVYVPGHEWSLLQ